MIYEMALALLPIIAGIVGVWVNLNSTVARLKSRVIQLEMSQDELKRDIKELLQSVHNIEIMLAKMHAE
jgi:prefoldin subunit 5